MNILHCNYLHRLANTHTCKQMHVCTHTQHQSRRRWRHKWRERRIRRDYQIMNMNTIQRIQYETDKNKQKHYQKKTRNPPCTASAQNPNKYPFHAQLDTCILQFSMPSKALHPTSRKYNVIFFLIILFLIYIFTYFETNVISICTLCMGNSGIVIFTYNYVIQSDYNYMPKSSPAPSLPSPKYLSSQRAPFLMSISQGCNSACCNICFEVYQLTQVYINPINIKINFSH